MNEKDQITLKWGTLKAWDVHSESTLALLKQYFDLGVSMGCAQQRDTPAQKDLLCQIIDGCTADEIYLDWDGKYVSKDAAKEYVMGYGK